MWRQGQEITALVVLFCAAIAPAAHVGCMLAILLASRRPPAPPWVGALLRLAEFHQPWAMVEVMMLGILVALVKIAELATVIPGIGMFAIGAVVVLMAAITVSFEPQEVWARVQWTNGHVSQSANPGRVQP